MSAYVETFDRISEPAPWADRQSSAAQIETAVARVRAAAPRFARLTLDERVALARAMQAGVLNVATDMVAAACIVKGLDPHSTQAAEEWGTGPWCIARQLRLVIEQLAHVKRDGSTRVAGVSVTDDGRALVRLLPADPVERILFKGCAIDARMQEGFVAADAARRRARFYQEPAHDGRTVLVLGAGNVAGIGPMDVITKLFNEGKVCVLKMNPVNAYLGPFIEHAFAAAIAPGYLEVVYGGAAEGALLTEHPAIDEIHLTGSNATFDAIVWGPPGPEHDARRSVGRPLNPRPVTAELGNISPVILVPGPYTDRELAVQAEDLAAAMTLNAGFYCNAARVLVTAAGWPGRARFLRALRDALARIPPRRAYYPGAIATWHGIVARHPEAERIGDVAEDRLPWTIVSDLPPWDADVALFQREHFCPVLGETPIASADPVEFLPAAVAFANERLWGTLSATLMVHPRLMRDCTTRAAIERAIADLRYGTVAVNAFPGLAFALAAPPWGGYPGATALDAQSGTGWVHNTAMLAEVEKTVLRCPLTQEPKPGYFPSHRTALDLMKALTRFERGARWRDVPPVLYHALRG